MMKRVRAGVPLLMAIWLMLGVLIAGAPVSAQSSADVEARVERAVIDLIRFEGLRDANHLYDRMMPESRMIIPRQAFTAWFMDADRLVPAGEPEIESITVDDWESDATGDEYEDVAYVEYSVPVENDRDADVREAEMLLWNDGITWRWFFSGMGDDIDDVADLGDWTIDYESPYSTGIYQQMDLYWAQIFENAGLKYHPPTDMVGIRVDSQQTGCGVENNIERMGVYYCTLDQTVYYDPGFRDQVIDTFGEYAWSHIMAHEWAHHVQNLLGLYTTRDPELHGGMYTIESELQADCLAGMFSQDARARGIIRNRDLNAAIGITGVAGDVRGTTWDDATAHGSGEEREEAFWLGFDDGFRGCHLTLEYQDGRD